MKSASEKWQGGCWQLGVGALALFAFAQLGAGCILPQNDHLLTAVPPARNRPPAILENTVLPSNRLIQKSSGPNCRLEFKVSGVIDPDVDDTIILQWYIDYSPNGQLVNPVSLTQQFVNKGTALRDPPPDPFSSLVVDLEREGPLHALGPHVVEALISDGTVYNHDPQKRHIALADGGTVDDETYAVTYAWFVINTDGNPCP